MNYKVFPKYLGVDALENQLYHGRSVVGNPHPHTEGFLSTLSTRILGRKQGRDKKQIKERCFDVRMLRTIFKLRTWMEYSVESRHTEMKSLRSPI